MYGTIYIVLWVKKGKKNDSNDNDSGRRTDMFFDLEVLSFDLTILDICAYILFD